MIWTYWEGLSPQPLHDVAHTSATKLSSGDLSLDAPAGDRQFDHLALEDPLARLWAILFRLVVHPALRQHVSIIHCRHYDLLLCRRQCTMLLGRKLSQELLIRRGFN